MTALVIALSTSTAKCAAKIADGLGARLEISTAADFAGQLRQAFLENTPIIALCASGIVIRILAPHLDSKHHDAPVIAVSEDGRSIVPLLGGHHGANRMAHKIAALTGGHAAITTAGDNRFNIALDEPPEGYVLRNPENAKPFMAALLAGASARINGKADWLTKSGLPQADDAALTISITTDDVDAGDQHLIYHPQNLSLSIGCERGCSSQELIALVDQTLAQAGIAREAIACIASIDVKADEAALETLSAHLQRPLRFFSAEHLNAQSARLKNPSDIVLKEVGCPGVSEGAALAAAGADAVLLIEKTKSQRATCALARAGAPITRLAGRARGLLSVVGLGPGDGKWRSPEATRSLLKADHWVGYDLYLDLAAGLKTHQCEHRFPLGDEEKRVRHAIALAAEGTNVALICSGDAGIYAMAALVTEVLDTPGLSDAETRIAVEIVPGISAFQAAAARSGALIGHDFCCISLSDLLTPWQAIEQRLKAAASGDFVTCFYNPRSLKRTGHLARAIDILTPHRSPQTPVVIASNLGRPEEKITIVPLSDFKPESVDMLTIVLIGSSQSRLLERGDGRSLVYTPRGYARKRQAS